jgi:hypothetical protein
MRFMTLIKSAENAGFGPPPPQLFHAIAALGGEAARAGVLVDTGGLLPTSAGARIQLQGGRISISDGPFESGETVGGYAIFDVESREEAIDWANRFMELHREHWKGWEGATEVRQLIPPPAGQGSPRG